jgi:hypothetical protein
MKKLSLAIAIVLSFSPFISQAQWTSGTGLIYYNGGNVGIGTSTPAYGVELAAPYAGNVDQGFQVSNGSSGGTKVRLGLKSTSGGDFRGAITFNYNGGAGVEMLSFHGNGNIGIGTISPGKNLTIAGNSGASVGAFIDNSNTSSYAVLRLNSGNVDAAVGAALHSFGSTYGGGATTSYCPNTTTLTGFDSGGLTLLAQHTTGVIRFFTSGTSSERMRINANGNVGIGTTTPSSRFHIYSSSGYDGITVQGGATSNGVVGLKMINSDAAGTYSIGVHGSAVTGLASSFYIYDNLNNITRFLIKPSGYVGIGTTAPDQLLTVKGTIHSQEVKVDLSVPGPDYVFEPTYKLPSLAEVKAFINKNHHLSEIPSAAEMAKNGLDLGDMNIKLLKKVEELTLHLIEKEEELKDQREKLNKMQLQINALIEKTGK